MSEEERLRSLRDLMALDTKPEPLFDAIARLASQVCAAPIALLSLVDDRRQWFKANVGLPGVEQTPREIAFCARAIEGPELFEVPDATRDPRFDDNPLVTGTPDIRFYAGVPLSLPDGARVGTLCVIDQTPRRLDDAQAATLTALAGIACEALSMRRALIERTLNARSDYERRLERSEARHRSILDGQSELVSLAEADGTLVYVGPAYARHFGLSPSDMTGANLLDHVAEADRETVRALIAQVVATGVAARNENRMVSAGGAPRWVSWTNSLLVDESGHRLLRSVGRDVTERRQVEVELRASQSLLARTGRLAGVGGWELDIATKRLEWSDQTRRIHEVDEGYAPAIETAIEFYAPEARSTIEAAVGACIADGTPWDLELPMSTAKGRPIWVRAQGEAVREGGECVRLLGAFADITERAATAAKLRELTAIVEATPDYVVQADAQGAVSYMNPAARAFCGLTADEPTTGRRIAEFNTPETNRLFATEIVPAVIRDGSWTGEVRVRGARGREISVSHMVIGHRGPDGRIASYSAVMRDISRAVESRAALQAQTESLRQLSRRDPLTGLLNRAGFEEAAGRLSAAGADARLAMLCVDLDHFKPVNDTHGHPAGDAVLREFAARVARLVRPTDVVARLGGDEFAILLSGVAAESGAQVVARKVVDAAASVFMVGSLRISIGASVGIAVGLDGGGWEGLFARADAKLYQAKGAGRGTHAAE